MQTSKNYLTTRKFFFRSSSLFGRASNPGQIQTRLGSRVYPFTTQAAVCLLPGSDAGSDVVKPKSIFVIQTFFRYYALFG